jgi:hypothetical protein
MSYPGFQALPPAIKTLLLVSESFFFSEARPGPENRLVAKKTGDEASRLISGHAFVRRLMTFGPGWKN